ncbi:MAG: hypothetical protein QW491_14840 [Thermoproteota archaeon]
MRFEKRERRSEVIEGLLKSKLGEYFVKTYSIMYKPSTFNPLGFDKSFPFFDRYVKTSFPSSRAVIEQFKRTNGILNHGKNPNSYLADAVATMILGRFPFSSDSLIHHSH